MRHSVARNLLGGVGPHVPDGFWGANGGLPPEAVAEEGAVSNHTATAPSRRLRALPAAPELSPALRRQTNHHPVRACRVVFHVKRSLSPSGAVSCPLPLGSQGKRGGSDPGVPNRSVIGPEAVAGTPLDHPSRPGVG